MDKANVIDLIAYRDSQEKTALASEHLLPEDLATAIQLLIQRLQEANPLCRAHQAGC